MLFKLLSLNNTVKKHFTVLNTLSIKGRVELRNCRYSTIDLLCKTNVFLFTNLTVLKLVNRLLEVGQDLSILKSIEAGNLLRSILCFD